MVAYLCERQSQKKEIQVCDPETKLFGYCIIPRFQLSNDFDWAIGGDSQTHSFSGKALADYCDKDKTMVRVVIIDEE